MTERIPRPPYGSSPRVKREWREVVKTMLAQGLNPSARLHYLRIFARLCEQEADLDTEFFASPMFIKQGISRQLNAIASQKLKVLRQLFAPQPKNSKPAVSEPGLESVPEP
jgi:hypothetical protein